ncbi:MAG: anion permease [Candidatus Magnetoovum sp. WYHC-5]|nr:anion permease [Candidatus Magnetoovum sp. WYHC-5]
MDEARKTQLEFVEREAGNFGKLFAWVLCIVLPALIYYYAPKYGVSHEVSIFMAIMSVTLVMWIAELLPDFVPGLFAILLFLMFGLAPKDVIMSGFSSDGFFLALSVLALGTVIQSSGLSYRYALIIMKRVPDNTFWYMLSLFFTGLFLTPLVPVIAGRASIVAPVLNEVVKHCDEKVKQSASTVLFASGINGITFLSAAFLSSTPLNLIIYGMLPLQEQQAFNFIKWTYASSVVALCMLVLYFIISVVYFKTFSRLGIGKDYINEQLKCLGKVKKSEWIAMFGVIILGIGIFTSSLHKISIPWIAFALLYFLLFIGTLNKEDFRNKIDWPFLFLLGSMIGLVSTMYYLDIDDILAKHLNWLAGYMSNNLKVFILLLSGTILLVRLIVPMNATVLIFAATLLPLAAASGVSPWLIGFIILLMSESSIFNYQAPYLYSFRNITKGTVMQDDSRIMGFNIILIVVKLSAIYISIPFWTNIGVL